MMFIILISIFMTFEIQSKETKCYLPKDCKWYQDAFDTEGLQGLLKCTNLNSKFDERRISQLCRLDIEFYFVSMFFENYDGNYILDNSFELLKIAENLEVYFGSECKFINLKGFTLI